ncbi:hypothetical protein LINGRAPRIM_LOCUS1351 [Linum grandiflorum]
MQPPDQCFQCFSDAVVGMQEVCPGSAGAVVSDNVNCCLRYELYDICARTNGICSTS